MNLCFYYNITTRSTHWPCYYTVHEYVVIHFCNSMRYFWVDTNLCIVFSLFVYIPWISSYKERRVRIPLTGLTRHIVVLVPRHDLDFQVICRCHHFVQWVKIRIDFLVFADIGGLEDHHCLNLIFMIIMCEEDETRVSCRMIYCECLLKMTKTIKKISENPDWWNTLKTYARFLRRLQ